jgi:mannitol-specific phosphotransferase system IIBC component
MEFEIKDVIYIAGIVASAIISFLGTRHKLKEYVRDKNDILKEKLSDLRVQLTEQKAKDDLQQQVIDQIGKQMDNLIPQLIQALNHKKESHE